MGLAQGLRKSGHGCIPQMDDAALELDGQAMAIRIRHFES